MNEPLKNMVKDLLKDYNESNKPFANIAECEEDCDEVSSSDTGSDFDRRQYEEAMDALKKPF